MTQQMAQGVPPQGLHTTEPLVWLRKVRERLTAQMRSVDYHIAMLCVENTEAEYRQARVQGTAPRVERLDVDVLSNALRIIGRRIPGIGFGAYADEVADEYARLTSEATD